MAEYIEREAAKARLRIWITDCVLDGGNDEADCFRNCIDLLDSIHAADVAPVVHAKWDANGRCTNCGCLAPFYCMTSTYHKSHYCFECGAKMEKEEE